MKRRITSLVVTIVLLGISGACVYNVVGDDSAVKERAKAVACGDQGASCNAQFTMIKKTPYAHTYQVVTPKRTVEVTCKRPGILVGSYACAL
ncbi:MAG: hypothetical protein U0271_29490 [Polyangiaceae bacterium]